MRTAPFGRYVYPLRGRTEFGSPEVLWVAATSPDGRWLGVATSFMPNGKLGWIERSRDTTFSTTTRSIHVALASRRLELRDGDATVRRMRAAIGRASSRTPTGRFAVTDKLHGSAFGPGYGCCVIALSGHPFRRPAGWHGPSRIAIHGTDASASIGRASSAGCLRTRNGDLRFLMRWAPLGTPVVIDS